MKFVLLLSASALVLSACAVSQDPADGGFFSGIVGVAGGGYQGRVDERQAALDAEQARAGALAGEQQQVAATSASIAAELTRLRAEHTALRQRISQQLSALQSAGVAVSPALVTKVRAAVNESPSGRTDAERLASLQAAIANARGLSADLARLS